MDATQDPLGVGWYQKEGGGAERSSNHGCAPVAAGTCVPRVFGEEMTGDPAMLPRGCEEDIDVIPAQRKHGALIVLVF